MSILTVENITALRNEPPALDSVVYVKCHTQIGDGGGGFFAWKKYPEPLRPDDDGITIHSNLAPPNPPIDSPFPGNWIRQFNGDVDVRFFGCQGLGNLSINDAIAIQKAIYYAHVNLVYYAFTKGCTVYIPNGIYILKTQLTLKNGVSIKGDGMTQTILRAEYSNVFDYMMVMDAGIVQGCNLSNFTLDGNIVTDPDQTETQIRGGMYFEAQTGNDVTGGLWNSTFKNITITRINGNGIFITAGDQTGSYSATNQLNTFENVYVGRQKAEACSLTLRGLNGQHTFTNCGFSGKYYDGDDTGPRKALKGVNVSIRHILTPVLALQTAVVSFINCSFQESEYAIYITSCESITFDTCWFENLDYGVTALSASGYPCKGINVLNSRFTNAASFGSLPITNKNTGEGSYGRCITSFDAEMNVHNNYVNVSDIGGLPTNYLEYFIFSLSASGFSTSGNSFQSDKLGHTASIVQSINPIADDTNYYLDLKDHKSVYVKHESLLPVVIQRLSSSILGGEKVTLRAFTGVIRLTTGKNLYFSNNAASGILTLNPGDIATFIKNDAPLGNFSDNYQLVSVFKSNSPA